MNNRSGCLINNIQFMQGYRKLKTTQKCTDMFLSLCHQSPSIRVEELKSSQKPRYADFRSHFLGGLGKEYKSSIQ